MHHSSEYTGKSLIFNCIWCRDVLCHYDFYVGKHKKFSRNHVKISSLGCALFLSLFGLLILVTSSVSWFLLYILLIFMSGSSFSILTKVWWNCCEKEYFLRLYLSKVSWCFFWWYCHCDKIYLTLTSYCFFHFSCLIYAFCSWTIFKVLFYFYFNKNHVF